MKFNLLISNSGNKVPLLKVAQETLARFGLPGDVIAGDINEHSFSFYFTNR